jgi:hypothetical protein
METTRAAQLVISNMDRTKPFSVTNSVCNNPPNTYHEYTLQSFVQGIDDKTKDHLFYKPIQEVFKNYLEKTLPDCMLRQERTNDLVNASSTVDSSLTLRSPPRSFHTKADYKSILDKLHLQWNDDQKSIWKIYAETKKVNPDNVPGMQNIGVTLLQLRNLCQRCPDIDVSESPFRNSNIANDNRTIRISDMFDKNNSEIFDLLYDMLKELTLIQEEKIRTTALVQNRGNNLSTSKNTNNFATLTVLLTELKHKYRETREEWNYMQRKEDINLVKQDIRDTIKPTLTIA